jgi:Leucine-rich repeat (LRR) protein
MVTKLQTFDLSWNAIKYIQPQTFLNNVHLKFLDMSRNQISDIDSHLFLQNPSITQFSIKHNKLNFVNDEPILFAPNLKYLDLDFCNINYLPIKAFQNLTNLKELHLSNNRLVKLDGQRYEQSLNTPITTQNIFSGPIQLEELDLSNNQFRSLETSLFENLQNLRRLDISGNPLECNCNLQTLRSWCLKQHLETGNVLCNDNAKSSWDRVDSMVCISTTTIVSSTSIPQTRQMSTKAVKQWIRQSPPTIKYVTAVICTVLVVAVVVPVSTLLWRCYKSERKSGQSESTSQDNACLIQDDDNFI